MKIYFCSNLGEEAEQIDSAIVGAAYRDRVYVSNIPNALFDGINSHNLNDVVDESLGRKAMTRKLNTITQGENSTRLGKITFI